MSFKPNLRLCALSSAALSLMACTTYPEFSVSNAKFLTEKSKFSFQGSTIEAIGYVRATIDTKIDIVEHASAHDLTLWFEVTGCSTGTELTAWPYVYEVPNSGAGFRYYVLFRYKDMEDAEVPYNLAANPEDVCFLFGMAGMGFLRGDEPGRSRLEIAEELSSALNDYEESEGRTELLVSDDCADSMCIPQYAK